jgi:phosphate:Na+ symporter
MTLPETLHWLQALGGLGLFLLAMLVMTEGLRGLAGEALHDWLNRATRSPVSGALTGTAVTALLQSSSATTVTTVGFVAAGLLTFTQALGVILGANVGTTATGWLVALLGFKLALGEAAYPLVLLGMMLRIFSRGRWAEVGKAVAGFGLLFIGIGLMQSGLGGMESLLTPAQLPDDTILGRLMLVGFGIALTLITQSSSAGVAVAMTAMSMGSIEFSQAAAMVIGMDVGTTVTALLAAIGSSAAARRTGYSHTAFNIFTATLALALLSPYMWFLEWWSPGLVESGDALALAGFHTLFNVVALMLVLPLVNVFARMMTWLVPERETSLAARLDQRLLAEPQAARAALDATLRAEFDYMLLATEKSLQESTVRLAPTLAEVSQDLADTRDYLDALNRAGGDDPQHMVAAIHAQEHLVRMLRRLQQTDRPALLRAEARKIELLPDFLALCRRLRSALNETIDLSLYDESRFLMARARRSVESRRAVTIGRAVKQELSVGEAGRLLAAYRWLEHMTYHVSRVAAHLGGFDTDSADDVP